MRELDRFGPRASMRAGTIMFGVGFIVFSRIETLTGFYISTGYKDVPGLILLLAVLAVRPVGLFGKAVIKKV